MDYGKRLYPLTDQIPKPMLPLGDRPLTERTIERLRQSGIHEVHVTTLIICPRASSTILAMVGPASKVNLNYANIAGHGRWPEATA